ncbi:site-specific DNA-methyltransferase, partial [uncultured Mailhella sp.]|uniref:DNA-methyltransferase n=1 Tax=uncultured Mailhella sp. TaxID=1981031 RepID=UPI0025DADD71
MPKKSSITTCQLNFDTFSNKESQEVPLIESKVLKKVPLASDSDFSNAIIRKNGILFNEDSLTWLKKIPTSSIDMVFADPPYNINKAEWDKFESQEKYIEWSMTWIEEASRVLKSNGTLFVCGFSEILADLKHPSMKYFSGCRWLIWYYKNKANLGKDWGRSHESILVLRKSNKFIMNIDDVRIPYNEHTLKYPSHPQATTSQYSHGKSNNNNIWTPNPLGAKPKDVIEVPTTCNGMEEKTKHPAQKPEELLRKLVLASTNNGDIIVDPFSGSGTTLVVAEQLGRLWMGCDINKEYNSWASRRLDCVQRKSIEEWKNFDK